MTISVCMIVRNEGTRLARALESVRGLADEIVVTDTGSSDDTVAIAKAHGARVHAFEWNDDFAAARNACAAHARGDWLLWLDGDERVKPGTGEVLVRETSNPRALAYFMVREEIFFPEEPQRRGEMLVLRLVRARAGFHWEGIIHEHLVPWPVDEARARGGVTPLSAARLEHWGYTRERIPDKCRRAARLCEAELNRRPGQLYYLAEWARSLIMLGTPEGLARAAEVLRESVTIIERHEHDAGPPSPLAASVFEQLLALPGQRLMPVERLLTLARRWFPRHVPLAWAEARIAFDLSRWDEAERGLRRLLAMLDSGHFDRVAPFDPRVREDASFNLGVCLVRQARLVEARALFEPLMHSPRRAEEARQNLRVIDDLRARFGD